MSILYEASKHGDIETIIHLHHSGIDIHEECDRALCISTLFGHIEVVVYLIHSGAHLRHNDQHNYDTHGTFEYKTTHMLNHMFLFSEIQYIPFIIKQSILAGHRSVIEILLRNGCI